MIISEWRATASLKGVKILEVSEISQNIYNPLALRALPLDRGRKFWK